MYSRVNTKQKSTGSYSQWKCINRKSSKCPAICSTLNDRLKRINGIHNHPPTFCEETMTLVKNEMIE